MLDVLRYQDLEGVLATVVRYFGGIKLGAGGLVRAYGGTAAECLRLAPREPIVTMARLGLHCDFAELALLKARLRELQAEVEQETFAADGVALQLRLPEGRVAEAQARINDISRGRIPARRID
jgi:putative IMPACT (imprinted ancient) family translation regulator